jgi:hypothetical protein
MFKAPATIPDNGIKTMADKSVRLFVDTQEVGPEEMVKLFQLKGKFGMFAFSEKDIEKLEVPDDLPEFPDEKSPSKRLKAVIWKVWESKGKQGDSEAFYRSQMERIIDKYKEKLN